MESPLSSAKIMCVSRAGSSVAYQLRQADPKHETEDCYEKFIKKFNLSRSYSGIENYVILNSFNFG